MQGIDDYVATYPTAPIHTADLAREFDVSIRTVGGYVSLPMSPGRTIEDWRARKDSNLRPSESKSDALSS
ncbi:protein of unknown function [Bradyrhizobium vignae]|uniref:Uncharacterized protein n=1 Tax=Bradyrhizobium vignae TaxID=1549949 RepID=A0A2U3Q064_9BRAD|nr:protein of unknown function [Bradyrhizobium vignae]